ncbi:MAG: tetratricopeptide repeat protein [Streptosporangiales bacterium]|nr:tetratricopeptide repeat protein [Streptosporangiales bacterium]
MTLDDIDELEFEAARTGDYVAVAERLEWLADTAGDVGDDAVSRAELLMRAGAQWQLANRPERAAEQYRRALDDGGRTAVDPRAYLADALFDLSREGEARRLIAQIRAEGPTDPELHNFLAETLEAQRDLEGAHEWATAGLELVRGPGQAPWGLLDSLLRARYRVRREMRLPEDEHDLMLDAMLDEEDRQARPGDGDRAV